MMRLRATGMIRFIIFAGLGVAQALNADVETVYGLTGERLYLSASMKNAQNCLIVNNKDETFGLKNLSANVAVANQKECSFSVKLSANSEGLWTVEATYLDERGSNVTKKNMFIVNVKDVIKLDEVLPSRDVKIASGNYVLVRLANDYDNVTSCTLIDQNGKEYIIDSDESDFVSKYTQCGARIKVNSSHSGDWKLYAHIGNNELRYGTFQITVVDQSHSSVLTKDVYAERESKSYRLLFAQNVIYCEIEDPHGKVVRKQQGSCLYDVPVVTSYHNGTWLATYYTKGQLIKLSSEIKLHVYEYRPVNATVTYDEGGNINLLCRYHVDVRITICRFEDPDKNVIFVNPGTGDSKYEYYGNGFGYYNTYSQDCGITIRQPNEKDFGIWRCLVDVKDKSSHEGSILHVNQKPDNFRQVAIADKIYVQRGNSFQIKCKAQSALKYCTIKSPNGTEYSTTTSKKLPQGSVAYEGAGLALGECGAILPGANQSDNGEWSCHMGRYEGPDLEARVPVIVTESSIMAENEKIELNFADMPITLSCVPIPGSEFDIDYCRWIKPDGTAIRYQTDARYSILTSHRYCKLIIKDNKYESVGRWSCSVGITYDTNSEVQAHVDIYYNNSDVYFISFGSCFVIVVFLALFFVLYRRRLRQRTQDNSIDFKYLI